MVQSNLKSAYGLDSVYIPNMLDPEGVIAGTRNSQHYIEQVGLRERDYIAWLGARLNAPGYKNPMDFYQTCQRVPR